MMGTPPYMAPEQVRGHVDAIDGRTDQFALGVICHRMLTGQEAFRGDDVASLLYQVVHENPPPISQFVPPTWDPAPLQAVLDRALAKEPERRWGGMMELARAFEEAAERTMCAPPRQRPAAAQAGAAVAADAAALDAPPPVRPRPQLRLVTPPSSSVPSLPPHLLVPQRAPAPQRSMRGAPALRSETPSLEWDLPPDVDRLPVTRLRAAVMGVFALALAATLIATGWYRELPGALTFVRDNLSALSRRPHPLHQPRAAQDPPPAALPAPAPKQPEPAMEGPQQQQQPAEAREQEAEPAATAKPPEPSKSARKSSRRSAAKTDASARARHRESPRVTAPVTPGDLVNEPVPTPAPSTEPAQAPPTAPATRSPGQPEGGFNIAPPTQFERGRDFAPPGDGTRDDTLEPSPPASMPTPQPPRSATPLPRPTAPPPTSITPSPSPTAPPPTSMTPSPSPTTSPPASMTPPPRPTAPPPASSLPPPPAPLPDSEPTPWPSR
jgi:serine/threonine protein kinase